jgi:hypothetical protein
MRPMRWSATALASLASCACGLAKAPARPTVPADPYAAIDAHALAAPAEARGSVQALAAYLTAPARDQREKARAIYRWITANIGHVDDDRLLEVGRDSDAEAVLRRGAAVCAGFSDLFTALARAAGLEAESIHGYAKGVGHRAGERVGGRVNHAWNAVKIDGTWQLVDCTWGAGTIENGVYTKRFSSFYFLAPPRAFAWMHFPDESRWQLVDPPLTLAEFEDLPMVRDPFFEYGLALRSHTSATIDATATDVAIRVDAPRGVTLTARDLCPQAPPRELRVRARGGQHWITVDRPRGGDCYVQLFAGRESERVRGTLQLHWAVEYRVVAQRPVESEAPAP